VEQVAQRRDQHPPELSSDVESLERRQRRIYFADRNVSDVLRGDSTGDPAIAALGAMQRGVVARFQLLALGISHGAIQHRLERYRLHPIHRGVYFVGYPGALPLSRETAALLACGSHAVLSHRSAAVIWWGLPPADERDVQVTITRGARRCRDDIRVRESTLPPADVKIRHRLPLTSPERTLIDLGRELPETWIEWAMEDGRRRGLLTRASVKRAVTRAGRRSGVRAIRDILDAEGGPAFTRSEGEVRLLALLRRAALHPDETNALVEGHEVDLVWRSRRLVVEVDGYAYHSGRAAFEEDRRRDADLQAAGYRVIRVTWRQLVEGPERVIARIARALGLA
jgi:very-short-patch-repair endonuclease